MAVPLTNSYDSHVYNITESQATGKLWRKKTKHYLSFE